MSVGIGVFIVFIGFKEMYIVVIYKVMFVILGDFGDLYVLLGVVGIILIFAFYMFKIKGFFIIVVLIIFIFVWVLKLVFYFSEFFFMFVSISFIVF